MIPDTPKHPQPPAGINHQGPTGVPRDRRLLPAGVQPPPPRTAEVRDGALPGQDAGAEVPRPRLQDLPALPDRAEDRPRAPPGAPGHRRTRRGTAAAGGAVGRDLPGAQTRIGSLDDHPTQVWNSARNEIVKRLLADTCEMCGSHDGVEVHHIRHLKDLNIRGRAAKPAWAQTMALGSDDGRAPSEDPGRLPCLPRGHPLQRTSLAAELMRKKRHWRAHCWEIYLARWVRWGAVGKGPGHRHLAGGLPNRTAGSESGLRKRTGSNPGTAPQADSPDDE
jgi:hypothetical protein